MTLTFGAGVALTPIGWLAVGLAAVGYATAWSIDKMVESGRVSPQTASAATTLFGGLAGSVISSIPQTAWDVLTGKRVGNSTYIPGVGFVPNNLLVLDRKKEGSVDPNASVDPLNDPNLEDISHPEAVKEGHHTLKDKQTGKKILYDKGKPGQPGHEAHDHYHYPNPTTTGKQDYYLDAQGNPIPKGSDSSHIYPPSWKWW